MGKAVTDEVDLIDSFKMKGFGMSSCGFWLKIGHCIEVLVLPVFNTGTLN